MSPVEEFGEKDIKNDIVSVYQGTLIDNGADVIPPTRHFYSSYIPKTTAHVDARDAKLAYYQTLS